MPRNEEFGGLLRTFRERLSPETAGVRPTWPTARRVPGLRRDELAGLASVSEEHLKRLEQGRRRPSRSVVDALAEALRLDREEHARLRLLAGFAAPGSRTTDRGVAPGEDQLPPDTTNAGVAGHVPREVTAPARRLLDRLTEIPTCVCDATWTVLDANRSWVELDCGGELPDRHDRNVAWRLFTNAPTAVERDPEYLNGFRSSVVADLRSAVRRYPADPQLRDLVADLQAASEHFVRLWRAADPGQYHADQLRIHHRSLGQIRLDKDVLMVQPGDLRVVVFTLAAR